MADELTARSGKNAWVIGDRTLPQSTYFEHISRLRKAGSDFFLLLIKYTLGKDFADMQCGLKGFIKVADEIVLHKSRINFFAFDFECLYIAGKSKIDDYKIPVHLRNQAASTVWINRDGWKLLKDVLKIIFCNKYD